MSRREEFEKFKDKRRDWNRQLDELDATALIIKNGQKEFSKADAIRAASPELRGGSDMMDTTTAASPITEDISNASDQIEGSPHPTANRYGKLKSAKKRRLNEETAAAQSHPSSVASDDANPRFAPAHKAPRKKHPGYETGYRTKEIFETRAANQTSDWYENINVNVKFSRGDFQAIRYVVELINRSVDALQNNGENKEKLIAELRRKIHEMEFLPFLSFPSGGAIIKKSRILEGKGLPQIFDNEDGVAFPWDIKTDARALYQRWIVGDTDCHLLRGVETTKGVLKSGMKRTSYKLDENFPFKKSSNCVGENGLVNGQWWPSRICTRRDGAHGETEAGIHGQTGRGVYSIVVSQGGYADEDKGQIIEYCGTESTTSTETGHTRLMLESIKMNREIRVLRAENKKSPYAPKKGLRYDGLYTIAKYEVLNKATAMYRFTLRRCVNQDPIRYRGPEIKPTEYELQQHSKIRDTLGMIAV